MIPGRVFRPDLGRNAPHIFITTSISYDHPCAGTVCYRPPSEQRRRRPDPLAAAKHPEWTTKHQREVPLLLYRSAWGGSAFALPCSGQKEPQGLNFLGSEVEYGTVSKRWHVFASSLLLDQLRRDSLHSRCASSEGWRRGKLKRICNSVNPGQARTMLCPNNAPMGFGAYSTLRLASILLVISTCFLLLWHLLLIWAIYIREL